MLCKVAEATVLIVHMQAMKLTKTDVSDEVKFVKQKKSSTQKGYTNNCRYCSKKHELVKTQCPAYGKSCKTCGKQNHFSQMCRQGASSDKKVYKKHTNLERKGRREFMLDDEDTEEFYSDSDFEVMTVDVLGKIDTLEENVNKRYPSKIMATFLINGQMTKMQIDRGATCNVLPQKYLPVDAKVDRRQKSKKTLSLYNNQATIPVIGTSTVLLANPKNK